MIFLCLELAECQVVQDHRPVAKTLLLESVVLSDGFIKEPKLEEDNSHVKATEEMVFLDLDALEVVRHGVRVFLIAACLEPL